MDNFRLGRHTKFLLMFTYEAAALAWETTRKKILPCHQTICSGSSIIHGLHNNEGRLRHWTTDKYSNPTTNHFSLKDIKCQCYDTCPQRFDIQCWDDNHFNYKLERLTAEWAIKMHFSNIFDTMWEIEREREWPWIGNAIEATKENINFMMWQHRHTNEHPIRATQCNVVPLFDPNLY